MKTSLVACVGAITAAVLVAWFLRWMRGPTVDDVIGGIYAQPELVNHSREFDIPQIVKVTEGVWVAVGYAIANSILVEGPEGLIVVDVTESEEAAKEIHEVFRRISNKPIVAIVYTHNHGDHIWGAKSFIDNPADPPDIWGYHTLHSQSMETMTIGPKGLRGIVHQLGTMLGPQLINAGLGPRGRGATVPFSSRMPLFPNKLVTEEVHILRIAGLDVAFLHIPGETPDQMAVWLPERRVLMPGDNIYHTFPNLYAIRGTAPRDTLLWANSLRTMRHLNADHLVPSHTQPVSGRQTVHDLLLVYESAIRFVHDQTVRRMNENRHPDEIARLVRLPSTLVGHPFLQEFYGRVDWSVKGVYERYIGWFSGDPVELLPLTPTERARKMVDVFGERRLLSEARSALKSGELQWALELASHVYHVNREAALSVRLESLRALAAQQSNPLARNFYLTTALDDHQLIDWTVDRSQVLSGLDMKDLLELMKIRLKAEMVDGVNMTMLLHFQDTGSEFRLQILYSVLSVDRIAAGGNAVDDPGCSLELTLSEQLWRELMLQQRSAAVAYATGQLKVVGSLSHVKAFFSYFK